MFTPVLECRMTNVPCVIHFGKQLCVGGYCIQTSFHAYIRKHFHPTSQSIAQHLLIYRREYG